MIISSNALASALTFSRIILQIKRAVADFKTNLREKIKTTDDKSIGNSFKKILDSVHPLIGKYEGIIYYPYSSKINFRPIFSFIKGNKFIFLVSFSQPDPSMSLTTDGLNNIMERR